MPVEIPAPIAKINVQRFIMLLKQTKIVPLKEIYAVQNIIKRMNKGQRISMGQRSLYNDVTTKASMNPMTNSFMITNQVRTKLKRDMAEQQRQQEAAAKTGATQ